MPQQETQVISKPKNVIRKTDDDHKKNVFKSKDGTLISYEVTGEGPGLIIIPGVMAVAKNYSELADALATHFTVYTLERRGRGISGPQGSNYSLTKECEDIQVLKEHTLAEFLFGHSYGGLIALEACKTLSFKKISVYEPAISIHNSIDTAWLTAYETYLKQGKPLDAFALSIKAGGPTAFQGMPLWLMKMVLVIRFNKEKRQQFYSLLPSNLNEQREIGRKNNTFEEYLYLNTPTLLLYGEKTQLEWPLKAILWLAELLPVNNSEKLANLDHFGPVKNARLVALELKEYFIHS